MFKVKMSKGRTVENEIKWRDPFRKLFQVELWDQIRVILVAIGPETSVPFMFQAQLGELYPMVCLDFI